MAIDISIFRMPRWREIPDVGLYLDQTIKYINRHLAPLGCMEITSSMVSNYVKKGYIASPVHKQYDADQIAHLFFIAIAKNVLSMENIARLFRMQQEHYDSQTAYDYFCDELEALLRYIFGVDEDLSRLGSVGSEQKDMLRSVIVAVANIIYLSDRFNDLAAREQDAAPSQPPAGA